MDEHTDSLVKLDRHPSRASLRSFGLALALIGFGRAAWNWPHTGEILTLDTLWSAGLAGVAAALAWLRPGVFVVFYVVLGMLTYPLRWLVAFGMLSVLYFVVITPVAWITRLFAVASRRVPDQAGQSAWRAARPRRNRPGYFRQF